MAELGLVAAVIQVAGFGATVAKNLYDAADVMIHANQEILALAKHVSQFTAVLKHMGEVLDAEKANCSKKVLRDIRSIKRSCKKTFKEIEATVRSKRFRPFLPVKWMFKRTKAMELESRLDSHQSMLQCIITTLTVSRLGHMETRSKEDSQHISGLKDEITLLKAFIMESYNNLTELRRNESRAEMESEYQPNDSGYGDSSAAASYPQSDNDQNAESGSSSSDDEPGPLDADRETSMEAQRLTSQQGDNRRDPSREISKYSTQPPTPKNGPASRDAHRESNLLLQMVPYRPKLPGPIRSDRLLPAAPGQDGSKATTSKGPTESVRYLLDKWTVSGSTPISTILDEESSKEERKGEEEEEKGEARREGGSAFPRYSTRHHAMPPGPRFGEFDDHFGAFPYPEHYDYPLYGENSPPRSADSYERKRPPYLEPLGYGHKDFWRSDQRLASPNSHLGDEILHLLRSTRGGIHYIKANDFQQVHYIDTRAIYTCHFVPLHLIPLKESRPLSSTEIGNGLVRKEALDLLGYSFSKTKQGTFLIQSDLDLRAIEELVKLSYQALDRKLTEQSRQIVKERGMREVVDDIDFRTPMRYYPPVSAPFGYSPFRSSPFPPGSPPRDPPSPPFQPTPVDPGQSQDGTRHDVAPREVRFTLPRARMTSSVPENTPTEKTTKTPAPTLQANPAVEKMNVEWRSLCEKRAKLLVKSSQAEEAKDFETATDLRYYAIPYIETQIKEKEREIEGTIPAGVIPDFRTGTPAAAADAHTNKAKSAAEGVEKAKSEAAAAAPPPQPKTEVETESEYDDDDDDDDDDGSASGSAWH